MSPQTSLSGVAMKAKDNGVSVTRKLNSLSQYKQNIRPLSCWLCWLKMPIVDRYSSRIFPAPRVILPSSSRP